MTLDEFRERLGTMRSTVGEEQGALLSDHMAELVNDYESQIETINNLNQRINENDQYSKDLLQENARLLRRVGISVENSEQPPDEMEPQRPTINDLIKIKE